MALKPFSFSASGNPVDTQQAQKPLPPPKPQQAGLDLGEIMARQMQQQGQSAQAGADASKAKTQFQRDLLLPRHLGMSGAPVQANGSSLTPESSWREQFPQKPGAAGWSTPWTGSMSTPAGPTNPTAQRPFNNPPPLTSPQGNAATDAANLAQNMQLYKPGGIPTEQAPGTGVQHSNVPFAGPGPSETPWNIQPFLQAPPPNPLAIPQLRAQNAPPTQKGSTFGFTGSPSSNFQF